MAQTVRVRGRSYDNERGRSSGSARGEAQTSGAQIANGIRTEDNDAGGVQGAESEGRSGRGEGTDSLLEGRRSDQRGRAGSTGVVSRSPAGAEITSYDWYNNDVKFGRKSQMRREKMLRDWDMNRRLTRAAIRHGLDDTQVYDLVGIITTTEEAEGVLEFLEKNPDATPREITQERRRILGKPM